MSFFYAILNVKHEEWWNLMLLVADDGFCRFNYAKRLNYICTFQIFIFESFYNTCKNAKGKIACYIYGITFSWWFRPQFKKYIEYILACPLSPQLS